MQPVATHPHKVRGTYERRRDVLAALVDYTDHAVAVRVATTNLEQHNDGEVSAAMKIPMRQAF
jgi:hypothetical protein